MNNVSTEVGEQKVKLKEVLKGAKGELIILQDFEQTKESLIEVAKKYGNFKVTKENLKESKEALAEVREYRYGVQNIVVNNKDYLNAAKKEMESSMAVLIDILKPVEDNLVNPIKEIENEKKIEKAKKEQEEKDRVANINKRLSDYRVKLNVLAEIGRTQEDEAKFIALMDEVEIGRDNDQFQEYGFDADEILTEYGPKLIVLQQRIEQIKIDAEKEIQLKKEREEFEAIKSKEEKAKKEEQEKLDADRKKFEQEKAKFEAEKQKAESKRLEEVAAKEKLEKEASEKINKRIGKLYELGFKFDGISNFTESDFSIDALDIKTYDDNTWDNLINKINEVNDKKKADEKIKEDYEKQLAENEINRSTFATLLETAKNIGADISEIEVDFEVVPTTLDLAIIQGKIDEKLNLLTEEKVQALKKIGLEHINKITPFHKEIIDYFTNCKILPEHENHIVTFEDEIRASLKKLKQAIS